jgi:hypothetical protein
MRGVKGISVGACESDEDGAGLAACGGLHPKDEDDGASDNEEKERPGDGKPEAAWM